MHIESNSDSNGNGNGNNDSNAFAEEIGQRKRRKLGARSKIESEATVPKVKKARLSTESEAEDTSVGDAYLDTINRSLLDFDFGKVCSVSVTNLSVYACLVCGKFYQGRGKFSHAYTHSLTEDHHVFINLSTLRFYVLPDLYEVKHSSLDDIKNCINPTFSVSQVKKLDSNDLTSLTLSHKKYIPGYVGLNNAGATDYANSVLQLLTRCSALRDFFLLNHDLPRQTPDLVAKFGLLIRKMWNPRSFKGHLSPHEFLQELHLSSNRQFKLTEQSDPSVFLLFLLNSLAHGLSNLSFNYNIVSKENIVNHLFQGTMEIETKETNEVIEKQFFMLSLDLPPRPLFQDEFSRNQVPQVQLTELLQKYSGLNYHLSQVNNIEVERKFQVKTLPRYLILHIKRFFTNNFIKERNPTVVVFGVDHLDMSPYLIGARLPSAEAMYTLVANVVHQGEAKSGVFKCHVRHRPTNKWYSIQDLHVEEILPHMITVAESCIQLWERRDVSVNLI